jgi:hypothetical protein
MRFGVGMVRSTAEWTIALTALNRRRLSNIEDYHGLAWPERPRPGSRGRKGGFAISRTLCLGPSCHHRDGSVCDILGPRVARHDATNARMATI